MNPTLARYNLEMRRDPDGDVCGHMVDNSDGVWVRYDDVADFLAQRDLNDDLNDDLAED